MCGVASNAGARDKASSLRTLIVYVGSSILVTSQRLAPGHIWSFPGHRRKMAYFDYTSGKNNLVAVKWLNWPIWFYEWDSSAPSFLHSLLRPSPVIFGLVNQSTICSGQLKHWGNSKFQIPKKKRKSNLQKVSYRLMQQNISFVSVILSPAPPPTHQDSVLWSLC